MRLIAPQVIVLAYLIGSSIAAGQTLPPKDKVDQALEDILRNKSSRHAPSTGSPTPSTGSPPAAMGMPNTAPPALALAVREQIRPCWNSPAMKSPGIVPVVVQMGRDARPVRAEPRDKGKYASDANYRAAADAGVRAVLNPRCQPWPLPLDKYESWKTITLNFDPN